MRNMLAAFLAVSLLLSGCSNEQAVVEPQIDATDATTVLSDLFEAFFERELELNPIMATDIGDNRYNDRMANSLGPEYRAASLALDEEYLARLLEIDREQLSRQDQLSYDMFRLNREISIEGHQYPGHLQPLNQFSSSTICSRECERVSSGREY